MLEHIAHLRRVRWTRCYGIESTESSTETRASRSRESSGIVNDGLIREEQSVDVKTIRSQVPALSKFVWFQNGFVSLTPTPIAEEHARLMRELYENGPMHLLHPDVEVPRRAASVDRIAEFLHVDTDEIALKLAVSDGFNTVINGMEWREGDQIIATEEEAAAILGPSLHLKQDPRGRHVQGPHG